MMTTICSRVTSRAVRPEADGAAGLEILEIASLLELCGDEFK